MPAVSHYLRAVATIGVDAAKADGAAVVAQMKRLDASDALFGAGLIRADGRKIHDMHLFRVKTPAASRGPWDLYDLVSTTPAEQAFRPLASGSCALVPALRWTMQVSVRCRPGWWPCVAW